MSTAKKIATHSQRVNSANPDADVEAVLHTHTEWWLANHGLVIARMRKCFPVGDNTFTMFNLQGHPYYGVDQLAKLWDFYHGLLDIPEDPPTRIVQFVLEGGVAWIAADALFKASVKPDDRGRAVTSGGYDPSAHIRVRSTECYLRDDGTGAPSWTMWHFHCSPAPDADEARPAFDDTARGRGELVS
jgi:hypothetical protein